MKYVVPCWDVGGLVPRGSGAGCLGIWWGNHPKKDKSPGESRRVPTSPIEITQSPRRGNGLLICLVLFARGWYICILMGFFFLGH